VKHSVHVVRHFQAVDLTPPDIDLRRKAQLILRELKDFLGEIGACLLVLGLAQLAQLDDDGFLLHYERFALGFEVRYLSVN